MRVIREQLIIDPQLMIKSIRDCMIADRITCIDHGHVIYGSLTRDRCPLMDYFIVPRK